MRRREFLFATGAVLVGGCSGNGELTSPVPPPATEQREAPSTNESSATAALGPLTGADFASLSICSLLPEAAAGPFPLDEQLRRRDITEGYPGHALRLGVRVVDQGCAPLGGADVEIWHADAGGDYSAFVDGGGGKDEGPGTSFLRGTQTTNDDGIVEFQTVYPGWYTGRAVHIHVRVRAGSQELTSQLYFDEAYTEAVLATGEYAQFGSPDTTHATDPIAGNPDTDGTTITLTAAETERGQGTLGLINVGITR